MGGLQRSGSRRQVPGWWLPTSTKKKGGRPSSSSVAPEGRLEFVQTDVTVEAQVRAMTEFAVARFGRIDCAHNNAGGPGQVRHRPVDETDEGVWDAIIDLNLKGVFLCMKHELSHMLEAGSGVIVNTASVSGHRGSVSRPAYTAAKHGVVGLTKSAAMDYARRGIRINAVSPGVTLTDRFLAMRGEVGGNEFALANMPIGRGVSPAEVAEAAVWLWPRRRLVHHRRHPRRRWRDGGPVGSRSPGGLQTHDELAAPRLSDPRAIGWAVPRLGHWLQHCSRDAGGPPPPCP